MNSKIKLGGNSPAFIVAELSGNHNHDINIAKETIQAVKEAGADAVKLQTYTPDTITIDCDNKYFQINQNSLWDGMTLYKLYQKAYTPFEWHKELFEFAKKVGITIFSTPFDKTAVDLLESLNNPIYKIASYEINDIPFIEYIASKKKPVIMATGISELKDIAEAIEACKRAGNDDIFLLKCTSAYPAPYEEINLKTMQNLKDTFSVEVGISDHTIGNAVSIAAVALGAKIVEKHVILDKNIKSSDADFSLDIEEFKNLVKDIRNVEKSLGKITYDLTDRQIKAREHSRSLFIVEDIKKGDIITEKNVRSIRPGYGINTKYLKDILGKKVKCDLKKGTPMNWKFLEAE